MRPTIVSGPDPRGRPGLATVGLILALGGVLFATLVAQGVIPVSLAGITATGATPPAGITSGKHGPSPIGTAPANFTAYRDPQGKFALYISKTWQAQRDQLVIAGQTIPATSFTPSGTNLPRWQLALIPTALDQDHLINDIGAAIETTGATNVTPTAGPDSVTIGSRPWTRVEYSAQVKGATVRLQCFTQPLGSGAVLALAESLDLNFAVTDKQNFTPMLASLALAG